MHYCHVTAIIPMAEAVYRKKDILPYSLTEGWGPEGWG